MSVKGTLSRFRALVTKSIIPKEFTDMIREDDTLFWSKPIGSSRDFHRAFHSKRTNSAIRYAMALSGILGEENVVNRALSGLRSNLHFKIEPQYSRSKGRLRLSHFEIKGYSPAGRTQYLDMTETPRKMIMGTPIDPYLVRFGVAAMAKKKPLSSMTKAEKAMVTRHAKALARYHDKTLPKPERAPRPKTGMKEATRVKLAAKSKLKLQKTLAERNIGKPRVRGPSPKIKLSPLKTAEHISPPEELDKIQPSLDDINKRLQPIDWNAGKPKKEKKKRQRKLKPTRSLTAFEKRKILRFFVELMKHLQGIMWILHYTIKLNDKRRKFHYIDENHKWSARPNEVTLYLYGFPEHLVHYIGQHHRFREWFKFFHIDDESEKLINEMAHVFSYAKSIDDKSYPNEEVMQDVLDVLLEMCSALLKSTIKFYEMVANMDWVFQIKVVARDVVLPPSAPRHKRHTKKNRVFNPEKDPQDIKLKVGYYKFFHGDYWHKKKL